MGRGQGGGGYGYKRAAGGIFVLETQLAIMLTVQVDIGPYAAPRVISYVELNMHTNE